MIVQYIGHIRLKGTSRKTGNPYDFVQVHYAKNDRSFIGRASATCSVSPDALKFSELIPDKFYDFEFDDKGNLIGFSPAKV